MPAQLRFQLINSDLSGNTTGAYYIQIVNAQGNLTNGNGVVVQYQQVLNGVPGAIQSVSIPGQEKKIYNGVIHNETTDVNYILVNSAPPVPDDPTPNPSEPDLALQSIQVTQKADAAGNNGKVKVNATSSNQPINYSIDGGAVNHTGLFTGVTAGLHTLTLTDASEAEIIQDFYVDKAEALLFKDPALTTGGYSSRWNAAFNPIVFEYHRKDFEVTAIAQDATTLKPKIDVNTDISAIVIGDYVYLDAGLTDGESTYKGAYKVLAKYSSNGIIIDADYVASDTLAGFMNSDTLRPYYKIVTRVKFVNPVTGRFETVEHTARPLITGVAKADISNLIQSVLKTSPDLSDYTQVNFRDMGLGISYQISYAEQWENSTPVYTEVNTPYYAIYSAKQLGEFGGGNLYDYVTQQGGGKLAKWLSDFTEPTYSQGSPFDLPFIYSEKVAGLDLFVKITALNINRQPLGDGEITTYLLNEDGSFLLQQDGYKFIIARQQLVNTPIVEHVGLNRLLINQDFGPQCYFLQVQLFYTDGEDNDIAVTQPIIVRVNQECTNNDVYLRWIGLNGSWNYYKFRYNQTVTLDVQNPVLVKRYVADWQNDETIEDVVSKDASQKVQVYADMIDKNDVDGLRSIKFSPKVQILTAKTPLKWQTIVVNTSTFNEYDTQISGGTDFSITFNKPSINIQTL